MGITRKNSSVLKKSKEDTFTLRVCIPKPKLRELFTDPTTKKPKTSRISVSFERGLLETVPNTFELDFTQFHLSGLHVHCPPLRPYRVHIAGIQISLLSDGVLCHSEQMMHCALRGGSQFTNEQRKGSAAGRVCNSYVCLPASNDVKWTDEVNELKVEITISKGVGAKYLEPGSDSEDCDTESEEEEDEEEESDLESEIEHELDSAVPRPMTPGSMAIAKYFMSTRLSDVSIKCGLETFPAHIFVLSDNSEVFERMFESDMMEAKDRCVTIQDSDSSTVREMLRYFYTHKVENLENVGMKLFELADRYMVDKLKSLCVNYLTSNLSVGNVLEVYYFGQKYQIPRLIENSKEFLLRNRKEFTKSYADLHAFMTSIPTAAFAADIFTVLMGEYNDTVETQLGDVRVFAENDALIQEGVTKRKPKHFY